MTSLGVGFWRLHKGLNREIVEVMLEAILNNELTAGVIRQDDRCWRSQPM